MKQKLAVAIISMMIASLSVAGCTSPKGIPSESQSETTQHNATLEAYINELQKATAENFTVKAWSVHWFNNTVVNLNYTAQSKTTNATANTKAEVTYFTSTSSATDYVNSLNKTHYSTPDAVYPTGGAYERAIGHAPAVYAAYQRASGDLLSNLVVDRIEQYDNIVWIGTSTLTS